MGGGSVSNGNGAAAFGWQANAGAANATAVGAGAVAVHSGSTAIGAGATSTRTNQVVLGGSGSSVTVGDLAASTAAQTGSVYVATTDASGTLGRGVAVADLALKSDMANLQSQINVNTASIDTLFDLANENTQAIKVANEGVAMALAMESPSLQQGQNVALSGGIGYYEKQSAATMALTARISENASVSAGVGVGFDSGKVGARGGFQIGW